MTLPPWRRTGRGSSRRCRAGRSGPPRGRSGSPSRTNPVSSSGSTSTYTETSGAPECRAALKAASWQASTSARAASSSGASPTTTTSTGTPGAARPGSRSPPRPAAAGPRAAPEPGQARSPAPAGGQADDLGRGVGPLIRARVGSTESCRWAAISARASERMRPRRSSASWLAIRVAQGPKIRPSPIRVMAATPPGRRRPRSGPGRCRRNPRPRPLATSRPPTRIRIRPTRPVNRASMGLPERRGQRARSRSSLRAQMIAEPAAARAIGQTIRSPNHRPISRSSSRLPSTTKPRAMACRAAGRGWVRPGLAGVRRPG